MISKKLKKIHSKIPCKQCIIKAVCKHKTYADLMKCEILNSYIVDNYPYDEPQDPEKILAYIVSYRNSMVELLKPTRWNINEYGKLCPP